MPGTTPCLFCQRVGFVRLEHTIKAAIASTDYYCGSCDRAWSVPDDDPERLKVKRAPPEAPEPSRPAKS